MTTPPPLPPVAIPPSTYQPEGDVVTDHDCGHVCCDERTDPLHDHFLRPSDCPMCADETAAVAATLADALLALHRPWYTINGKRHEHRVYVAKEDVPEGHVCKIGPDMDTCDGEDHYVEACYECRWATEDGEPAFPIWPCPTARLAFAAGGAS